MAKRTKPGQLTRWLRRRAARRLMRDYSSEQLCHLTRAGVPDDLYWAAANEGRRREYDLRHPETIAHWQAEEREAHAKDEPLVIHWRTWAGCLSVPWEIRERRDEGWRALLRRRYVRRWLDEARLSRLRLRRAAASDELPARVGAILRNWRRLKLQPKQRRAMWRTRLHPPLRFFLPYIVAELRWRWAGRPQYPYSEPHQPYHYHLYSAR